MNTHPTTRPRRRFGVAVAVLAMATGTAGAIALFGAPSSDAAPATARVVVRPVTASGHAAKGWQVHTESRSVRCYQTSVGAVDNGIAFCGTSADYTVACWHAAKRSRVLCLPDPKKSRLESIKLSGTFPKLKAPRHPSPLALRTRAGGYYLVRDGGAGPSLKRHPSWVEFYFGANNGRFIAGPKSTDGISRKHAAWLVTSFATPSQQGLRQNVATAYFVGNRH